MAELLRIRALNLVAQGAVEEHYVLVSSCVRRYVEDRFGLRAPEMTTEEFLEAVRNSPALERSDRVLLESFMAECDLVKFARHVPPATEAEAAITTAEAFVRETAPRPAELVMATPVPVSRRAGTTGRIDRELSRPLDPRPARAPGAARFSTIPSAYRAHGRVPRSGTPRHGARDPASAPGARIAGATLAALACFIVGAARPQLGNDKSRVRSSGIDVVLALDCSGSMRKRSISPRATTRRPDSTW